MTSPVIHLGGAQLPWDLASRLLSVTVERVLNAPAHTELVFADDGFTVLSGKAAAIAPGTPVTVAFLDGGQPRTVFTGTVTGLRVTCPGAGDHRAALTLVAEDAGHGLDAVQQVVTSANASLADVLRTVLSGAVRAPLSLDGLPAGQRESVLVASSPAHLLRQVCDRYGAEWWVDPVSGTFTVAAPPTTPSRHTLTLGDDLASLDFEATGTTTGTVTVRGWDPAAKSGISAEHTGSGAPDGAPAVLRGPHAFGQPSSTRRYEMRATSSVDSPDVSAQATALARHTTQPGGRLVAAAFGILPALGPRDDLVLDGAGPLSGTYPIVAVRHEWGERVVTWITAGARGSAREPSDAPSMASPVTPSVAPGMLGVLVPGLVTDISDPRGWGRVKVALPTFGSDIQTAWARTVLPGAGPGRGLVVPHRVNDEVLVGFEDGDPQRPVVLGAMHNGKDAPPPATAGREQILSAGLTTASGHQIVATDGRGADDTTLTVKHAAGHQLHLTGSTVLVQAESGASLKLSAGGASIVLDAQGNVKISGTTVTVSGQSSASLKAQEVTVSGTTAALQASATATVKGATVQVSADSMATIKGAMVAIN